MLPPKIRLVDNRYMKPAQSGIPRNGRAGGTAANDQHVKDRIA